MTEVALGVWPRWFNETSLSLHTLPHGSPGSPGPRGPQDMTEETPAPVKSEMMSPKTAPSSSPVQALSSPLASPKSPMSQRTSFPGDSPSHTFTPPPQGYPHYPPASLAGLLPLAGSPLASSPLKPTDSLMNRHCSDLIRSLAAKYNNNNPNE